MCLWRAWKYTGSSAFSIEDVWQTKYKWFSFICVPLSIRGRKVSEKCVKLYKAVLYTHPMLNGVCFIEVLIQKIFLYLLGEQMLKKMKVFDISVNDKLVP